MLYCTSRCFKMHLEQSWETAQLQWLFQLEASSLKITDPLPLSVQTEECVMFSPCVHPVFPAPNDKAFKGALWLSLKQGHRPGTSALSVQHGSCKRFQPVAFEVATWGQNHPSVIRVAATWWRFTDHLRGAAISKHQLKHLSKTRFLLFLLPLLLLIIINNICSIKTYIRHTLCNWFWCSIVSWSVCYLKVFYHIMLLWSLIILSSCRKLQQRPWLDCQVQPVYSHKKWEVPQMTFMNFMDVWLWHFKAFHQITFSEVISKLAKEIFS